MDSGSLSTNVRTGELTVAGKKELLLRLIRAAQPISRTQIAERLNIDKSTVTENVSPLVKSGLLHEVRERTSGGRYQRLLSFAENGGHFIGVNLGARRSQIGWTTLCGDISDESEFVTPSDPKEALKLARERIEELCDVDGKVLAIGVSIPGMADPTRQKLIYAPNLSWRDVNIAEALRINKSIPIVVENDATAAATYEARMKLRASSDALMSNFVLVRSGTGIGVGLVIGGEVYRGTGLGRGIAGEFGHMTIVAGGKQCVCGNRGCWEQYASAASAATLYTGDRPLRRGETLPRFIEIVSKAENGENRARRTLEKVGDYLGIGIANVIMGSGIPKVVISGRLVYSWKFIATPIQTAVERSIVGKTQGWTVEPGSPAGAAIGGALEVAVEEYFKLL
jgi:predicted NBD/HSP70 family sugar kinase